MLTKSNIVALMLLSGLNYSHAEQCETTGHTDTPVSRFLINVENGTAIDRTTNLMWKRCIEGMVGAECSYSSGTSENIFSKNWTEAVAYAETHEFAGHDDWRIPNSVELMSIFDYKCYNSNGSKQNHGINFSVFPMADLGDVPLTIWTSSHPSDRGDNLGVLYFSGKDRLSDSVGLENVARIDPIQVRLVREVSPVEFEPVLTQGGK